MPSPVYFEAAPLPHEARIIAVFLSNTMDSFTFEDYLREIYLTVERGRFIEWLKLKNQTQTEEQFVRFSREIQKNQTQTEEQFDRYQTQTEEQFDRYQTQTEQQFDRFHREIQVIKDLMMTQKSAPGNIHLRWHSIIP